MGVRELRPGGVETSRRARALLDQVASVRGGRPCDSCRWEDAKLIDEVFEALAADAASWPNATMEGVFRKLCEAGYPMKDVKSLRKHVAHCRPELAARVRQARPQFRL